ncbi:periplasmic heavy metal sensor [Tropicibacter sp. Alg240-R139]|uniref:periplasmic heavy metal sensor n=1 Tax=Tropicibacter sp. Alg240-R139 TaxID=2305991 RepID=UPI0013DEEE24|nr:periplasmic heavy metal sensor [Tropicibacter sp. Alg240-R139]
MAEQFKRKWPWMRILLITSLAVNLLFVGLIVGAALRFGGPDSMRAPPRSLGSALYRALPDDVRQEMRQHSRSGHGTRRRGGFKDVGVIVTALRAVPFDAEGLESVMDRQLAQRETFHRSIQDKWFDWITSMSDEGRATYADRLEEVSQRKTHKN